MVPFPRSSSRLVLQASVGRYQGSRIFSPAQAFIGNVSRNSARVKSRTCLRYPSGIDPQAKAVTVQDKTASKQPINAIRLLIQSYPQRVGYISDAYRQLTTPVSIV
jgi:hypothetical protein